MDHEVWVGRVELRQLPGYDHPITLSGKGAFSWITCWADNTFSYERKVSEAMGRYGLFIVGVDNVLPFAEAAKQEITSSEILREQFERTSQDNDYVIYGTFHKFPIADN